MAIPSNDRSSTPSLRESQRRLTRDRIVTALAALIEEEHPLEISMAQVADRAAVSEPTLYRHFPTKRELFAALADMQFRRVVEGVDPRNVEDLAEAIRVVYRRSEEMEAVVRWTLAAPDPERMPRPNVEARLSMLRTALQGGAPGLPEGEMEQLLRVVLLITSPMSWLYWRDYLGLNADQAADLGGWAVRHLAARGAEAQ